MLKPTIQLEARHHFFKSYTKIFLFFIFIWMQGCGGNATPTNINPVKFDLEKYLGTWYEIARYKDHWFEKDLEEVTAKYTKNPDGSVKVENSGTNKKGKREIKIGKAKFVNDPTTGHLKVSFFGPFYGSYVIFHLEEDYSVALITSDKKEKYCWILSRTPELSPEKLEKYMKILEDKGFDTNKLYLPRPYQAAEEAK
jgi:apolipoprotein D and lipocalin family protein